jgi:ABC-type oligopeptide transport system substrate-binding subunit
LLATFPETVRNPAYHGSFSGNILRVELTLGVDIATHFELYDADRLDLVDSWFFAAHEIERLRQRHPEEYICRPRFATTYIFFDVTRPPFDDPRVRRAFAMAVDRTILARVLYKGYELPATSGFVPPGMPGYSAGIGLPYDPPQARQLLAQTLPHVLSYLHDCHVVVDRCLQGRVRGSPCNQPVIRFAPSFWSSVGTPSWRRDECAM